MGIRFIKENGENGIDLTKIRILGPSRLITSEVVSKITSSEEFKNSFASISEGTFICFLMKQENEYQIRQIRQIKFTS